MEFRKKETPKIEITKKEAPKIDIKEVFPSRYKKMIGEQKFSNLEVDPAFGQKWNLANLTTKDLYTFGNEFYKKIVANQEGMLDEGNKFYQTLVKFNPELKEVKIENTERMLDVIRGVGSGLHLNDVKYFVEELKGIGENESEENLKLWEQAYIAYFKRNGIEVKHSMIWEDPSDEETKKLMESPKYLELDHKIGFAFSPETCRRIISNNPYNKE
jgi:hypothetical protein